MKTFVVVALALASFACAKDVSQTFFENPAYGYLSKIGIPEAERIRKAEEKNDVSRIVGGVPAALGQYPYQAGLLIDIINNAGRGICGGSLISTSRLITAAHCWTDGMNQAWRLEVVLGTVTLFSGGTRILTSAIALHPNWFPLLARNDIAVIYLPNPVSLSNTISTIALPTGPEVNEDYAGASAIASGFGITADGSGISSNQVLSHVRLNVITNRVCGLSYPLILQNSNICTSGLGGHSTCSGDSGGPLVATSGNRQILIGVTSFGNGLVGCEGGLPAAYARVTSFIDFIIQHL